MGDVSKENKEYDYVKCDHEEKTLCSPFLRGSTEAI
jgi:hypothetical protein